VATIKDFTPRLYQETILNTAAKSNTLIVLPTGMGKTNIFLMIAAQRLSQYPDSKVLLIGPTRPLIDQYLSVFKKHFILEEEQYSVFTGMIAPEKRAELWKKSKIIFSTPQGLENDIISKRIDLKEVSLLGIDEAHRAVGDYSYVFVAKYYNKYADHPRIIGLTASPGSDMEKIQEVCKNLFIEAIEVRTEDDPDVKPYIQEMKIDYVKVELPKPFIKIQQLFKIFIKNRLTKLKEWGMLKRINVDSASRRDLIDMQAQIRGMISQGNKDYLLWSSISLLAEVMKIHHSLELLETQGIVSLKKYMDRLTKDSATSKVKAVKNIVVDTDFKEAYFFTTEMYEQGIEHPKLVELQKIVENEIKNNPTIKIIIFNQYRENASDIKEKINTINGVKAQIFVGQQKKGDTGLSQKQQKQLVEDFTSGIFNILVATSIGEEGLDIPKVDMVIFFEPIPSAIRSIQRRGRTSRLEKGRIIMIIAKDTRDEAYRWTAHHKEKRMFRNLEQLRRTITIDNIRKTNDEKNHQRQLLHENGPKSMENDVKVFVDHREKGNKIVKELLDLGCDVKLDTLNSGDFVISSRAGIEYKTKQDFVNSIIDGRLLEQIKNLKSNFERPLIIIEGEEDIYSMRNIHPNAIRGMMATITVSYGIPIVQTKDNKDTAALIFICAKREQEETKTQFSPHAEKRVMPLKEQQEYVVSSLPDIGPAIAKELLKDFGSVKKIFNASQERLEKTEKIGSERAKKIRAVVDGEYKE